MPLHRPVGYFISNQHLNRKLDPNINVLNGIYNIRDKSNLHVHIGNYTHKHVMSNKGQCISHTEPSIDYMLQTAINSLTTQRRLDEHVQPDTFTHLLHTLPDDVRKLFNQLLETFKSQFSQDEINIGTIHLTKM